MNSYAAFIRGIMPTNPNMRNEKVRAVFEALGLSNVRSLLTSGNVIFKSRIKDSAKLEKKIEKELASNLGIKGGVFVRSLGDLEKLVKKDPFKGAAHSRESYLLVTFLKKAPWEAFTTVDVTKTEATKTMGDLEKRFGKENTSRTWKTVERILARLKG